LREEGKKEEEKEIPQIIESFYRGLDLATTIWKGTIYDTD